MAFCSYAHEVLTALLIEIHLLIVDDTAALRRQGVLRIFYYYTLLQELQEF
jgi:hypothetical protein